MKTLRAAATAAAVLGAVAAMFLVPQLLGRPMTSVGPVVGYATVRGHDAVIVAYERTGRGMPLPFGIHDVWQERVAAVSLDTGELLWDTKLHGRTSWTRGVLAVADGLAYVATDLGLTIVATEDGGIVARPRDILGDEYVEAYHAYNVERGSTP
ncbi:PA2928 family protein [Mycobacterium hubeiense]|uniref:PA2928 family protein n=1 Tax=Mycobacterium hubeiense TaxID=1867256 RepID=UPI001E3C0304|nr:PA2928 family protein [Mycobacterium sp. QGD 101]